MSLTSRLCSLAILGSVACVTTAARAEGGAGGAAGKPGGSAGVGGKSGAGGAGSGGSAGKSSGSGGASGASGASGGGGASGFTLAVVPKSGGVVAGTGNKTAILAKACEDDLLQRCARSPNIVFDKKQKPPGLGKYEIDTGWIPQGSPVAVKFALKIPAETNVHLETPLVALWPDAITLQAPGTRKTGALSFNYGLETSARVKVDADEIFGQKVYWEGDVPYVPKIQFGVSGSRTFDPWVWDGIRAEGATDKIVIVKVNLLQVVTGIPSWLGEAGLQLTAWGELGVTYRTDRVVITPSEAPITKDDASTVHKFEQGAWAEYKIHPEGTVDYDGTIHISPEFVVGAFGKTFAITLYDYDYPVDLPTTPYVFDDQLVHVPLPDLRLPKDGDVIDIGKVTIGEYKLFQVAFPNVGEAQVIATTSLSDAKSFQALNKSATAEPGKDLVVKLGFQTTQPGPYTATLLIASNDPDSPYIKVTLKGEGIGVPDDPRPEGGRGGSRPVDPGPEEEEEGGQGGKAGAGGKKPRSPAVATSGDEGGCGCRVTPPGESPRGDAFALFGITSLLALRSRARRSPPARETAR